jgi:preprotein translocase subunit YajC
MNWYIIIPVGIIALGLIYFLFVRNQKDEKEFEGELKEDYPKGDTKANDDQSIDEVTK